jgi:hypothetical protein
MDATKKCARTACQRPGAVCGHRLDHRWYCVPCARKINEHNPTDPPLVTIPDLAARTANYIRQSEEAMHAAFDLRAEINDAIDLAGG